jgi:hypothetical protein
MALFPKVFARSGENSSIRSRLIAGSAYSERRHNNAERIKQTQAKRPDK